MISAIGVSVGGMFAVTCLASSEKVGVIQATFPENAQDRRKQHSERNSAPILEKLAHRLAAELKLNAPGIREGFARCYRERAYGEALDAYRDYVLAKLAEPEQHGIPQICVRPGDPDPEEAPMDQMLLQTSVEELMQNIVTVRGKRIDVGEPGTIHWLFVPPGWEADEPSEPGELLWHDAHTSEMMWIPRDDVAWEMNPAYFARMFRQPMCFNALLHAYLTTGQHGYLSKWSAYLDDWSMHQQADADRSPQNVHLYFPQQIERFLLFLGNLAYATQQSPRFAEELPAATLIRLLLRRLPEVGAATARIQRVFEGNWRYFLVEHLVRIGILFHEFHFSDALIHEGVQSAATVLTTMDLPDGTDYEANPCYAGTLAEWMAYPMVELARNYPIEAMTPAWTARMREAAWQRARSMLALLMPNGRWPIYGIQDERQQSREYDQPRFRDLIPEFFDVPDHARRLNRAFAGPPPHDPSRLFGIGQMDPPSYASEALPYCGLYFLRAGWEPEDAFGMLKSTCHNIGTGCSLSDWQNDNVVSLYGFGAELLFNHHETPVTVDGYTQAVHWGVPVSGHTGYMPPKPIHPEPAPRRWFDSEHFAFAEGVYDRRYGEPGRHIQSWLLDEEPEPGITDVIHQRQLLLIKPLGIWIITDRLESQTAHEYAQKWMLHLPEEGNYGSIHGFAADDVELDAVRSIIRTHAPAGPNLSIYQVGSAPLRFETAMAPANDHVVESWTTEGRDPEYLERGNYLWAYTIHRIDTVWQGEGNQMLVTLVYPQISQGADLEEVVPIREESRLCGFSAVLPTGGRVEYRAALDGQSNLRASDIEMEGESLIVATMPDGEKHGMALGGERISFGDTAQFCETPDMAFSWDSQGAPQVTAVQRPIAPVRIHPEANGFLDQIEVCLSTPTPDTSIHYTLDGGEPNPRSPLYVGPVTLTETTTIKARAFRKGVTASPATLSGTDATAVCEAQFTRESLRPSVSTPSALEPGLRYELLEGHWRELMLRPDSLDATASGVVAHLLDAPGAPTHGSFAFRYVGYLCIPADGVYSFRAVHPMYDVEAPNNEVEHEMHVAIDGELWAPATGRHSFGTWSVALQKGWHTFQVTCADFRKGKEDLYFAFRGYRAAYREDPALRMRGPGIGDGPIPAELLWHSPAGSDSD